MISRAARNARRILKFLAANSSRISPLLILTHDYPDPDTLASAFCLHYLAERVFGIQSKIVYGGIIGRTENREMVRILKIPVHRLKTVDLKKYDHVALMDTQPGFKNNSFPANRRATVVIDQHPFVKKPSADLVIVDPTCGATCVILAQALLAARTEIPARLATAIAYGILSDTLNLYRADHPDIVQTYLHILPHADIRALAHIQNPSRSKKFFVTLAKGIQKAMARRALIVSHLRFVENPDLIAQVADFLLTYRGMRWSLCTGRFNGRLHVSLRIAGTQSEAGEILRDVFTNRGEAGGHGAIAGGSFEVGRDASEPAWREAERALAQRLGKRIRLPAKREFYFPFQAG